MKKTICILFLFLFSIGISLNLQAKSSVQELENNFISISSKVGRAVVTVNVVKYINQHVGVPSHLRGHPFLDDFLFHFFNQQQNKQKRSQAGIGTGFIISDDGYILTNDHVIDNADEVSVTLPDGRSFPAKIVGTDTRGDIALLKVEEKGLPYVELGDSSKVVPGQWTMALGHPFGNIVNNPQPTVTAGIVSAIHRTVNIREHGRFYGDLIQTDASINQGNSGGPLVNLKGEVIGINTLIFSPSGGNVGIGFSIPINRCKRILDDLIQGNEIKHAWLGVWLQEVDRNILQRFDYPNDRTGALIFKVEPKSPAQKSGLKSGDIITDINNQSIYNPDDVSRIVSNLSPDDEINVGVFSKGKQKRVKIQVKARKDLTQKNNHKKADNSNWRGAFLEDITDEIKEERKLQSTNGVYISNVKLGSPTQRAGIKPGDIIFSFAQKEVNNKEDLLKSADKHEGKDILVLTNRGFMLVPKE